MSVGSRLSLKRRQVYCQMGDDLNIRIFNMRGLFVGEPPVINRQETFSNGVLHARAD